MKVVFEVIPMSNNPVKACCLTPGNEQIHYEIPVYFAINGILAKTMEKGEKVKVVLIKNSCTKENELNSTEKWTGIFKDELNQINTGIGAVIEYVEVETDYDEAKNIHRKRFSDLINNLEQEAKIYTEITFGQKTLVPLLFSVMNFAEKFFDADIQYVVYSAVKFGLDQNNHSTPLPETKTLYDITEIYYLNNLTAAMEAPDGKAAVKLINRFFEL